MEGNQKTTMSERTFLRARDELRTTGAIVGFNVSGRHLWALKEALPKLQAPSGYLFVQSGLLQPPKLHAGWQQPPSSGGLPPQPQGAVTGASGSGSQQPLSYGGLAPQPPGPVTVASCISGPGWQQLQYSGGLPPQPKGAVTGASGPGWQQPQSSGGRPPQPQGAVTGASGPGWQHPHSSGGLPPQPQGAVVLLELY